MSDFQMVSTLGEEGGCGGNKWQLWRLTATLWGQSYVIKAAIGRINETCSSSFPGVWGSRKGGRGWCSAGTQGARAPDSALFPHSGGGTMKPQSWGHRATCWGHLPADRVFVSVVFQLFTHDVLIRRSTWSKTFLFRHTHAKAYFANNNKCFIILKILI